jgi:hypothetical protein
MGMARGALAGAASLVAALAALAVAAPNASALILSCSCGTGIDEIVVGGDDDERTRTVIGYKPSEKVFVAIRDILEPKVFDTSCGPAPGGWDSVTGAYGALDDRFRVDGKGLPRGFGGAPARLLGRRDRERRRRR